ncbi:MULTISPECIES: DUF2913 family protein [Vibrio]|nr:MULTISPECIES: DUF2913 family protein [Vibrio]EED27018.1 conserved hypothetical protein [Vibrio sp. 16]KHD26859.1 alpha-acetolactate decarboxylase [Vibrio caribbeanicus]KHT46636.1 alpha-acetolactate decarboxylase [Vibrio sinaloensis]CAK4068159.1 hypothetical protein VDT1_0986 [Vibrio sp. 16]
MSEYTIEIQKLVNTALAELAAEHKSGKAVNAPAANNLYLLRWVTRAIKAQRFPRVVSGDLIRWQKMGRSKGNDAGLMMTFERISKYYAQFFPEGQQDRVIKDHEINAFIDMMEEQGWEVTTSEALVDCGKIQIFTEGPNSLAMCTEQCESCFDGEVMIKPMNWFVRGHHADFIEKASAAGFMVHKVTDYKSNVKYHGEYLVYPDNRGEHLAEIPLSFKAQ